MNSQRDKGKGLSKVYKDIRTYTEWFIVYAVIGWLYESVWCVLIDENGTFINRGFLYGPWIPVYGFGMFIVLFFLTKTKIQNGFFVFLSGALLSTAAELITSYFLEYLTGHFLWDYSDFFMNFEGRIAVKPEIMFGLLVLFGIKVVHPWMKGLQTKFRDSVIHDVIFIPVALLFFADVAASLILKTGLTGGA